MFQKIKEKIINTMATRLWILPVVTGIGIMTALSTVAYLVGSIDNAVAMRSTMPCNSNCQIYWRP